MFSFPTSSVKRFFSTAAIAASLGIFGIYPAITWAQNNSGLTIFSGVDRKDQLSYYLDFGGESGNVDRYRLKIPAKKLKVAINRFALSYPNYYKGKFDPSQVEILVGKEPGFSFFSKDTRQSIKVSQVEWDQQDFNLQIFLEQRLPAGQDVEIVLSNVQNPSMGGTFYFNCNIEAPGDVGGLVRYVGTWIISIT